MHTCPSTPKDLKRLADKVAARFERLPGAERIGTVQSARFEIDEHDRCWAFMSWSDGAYIRVEWARE